ncbi:MAG: hypothetical protein PW786_12625 [Arachidicoccus sp.]|nr:hypothetical protein [Arachidicoccus sp.]
MGTKDVRDQKKIALIQLLNMLALYVQGASNGIMAAMASSGFSVSKTPEPVGILA